MLGPLFCGGILRRIASSSSVRLTKSISASGTIILSYLYLRGGFDESENLILFLTQFGLDASHAVPQPTLAFGVRNCVSDRINEAAGIPERLFTEFLLPLEFRKQLEPGVLTPVAVTRRHSAIGFSKAASASTAISDRCGARSGCVSMKIVGWLIEPYSRPERGWAAGREDFKSQS